MNIFEDISDVWSELDVSVRPTLVSLLLPELNKDDLAAVLYIMVRLKQTSRRLDSTLF